MACSGPAGANSALVRLTPVPASHEDMVALARAHALAEEGDDPAPVLETLGPDCVYELQPVGLLVEGLDAARRYYEHFFRAFRPLVAGFAIRGEWTDDNGLGQEYTIWTRTGPQQELERHEIIGILTFGVDRLSGERVYASERLLRMMFGPVYDEARPVPALSPPSV